jgi:hypothetical protein
MNNLPACDPQLLLKTKIDYDDVTPCIPEYCFWNSALCFECINHLNTIKEEEILPIQQLPNCSVDKQIKALSDNLTESQLLNLPSHVFWEIIDLD